MKATCNRQKLLNSFQTATAIIPSRSPKPILQNVKLEVRKDETELLATDLEVGIRCKVFGVELAKPGEVVLPANKIISILRELTDEQILAAHDSEAEVLSELGVGAEPLLGVLDSPSDETINNIFPDLNCRQRCPPNSPKSPGSKRRNTTLCLQRYCVR